MLFRSPGIGSLCRALIGHPELSTTGDLLISYYDPGNQHVDVAPIHGESDQGSFSDDTDVLGGAPSRVLGGRSSATAGAGILMAGSWRYAHPCGAC